MRVSVIGGSIGGLTAAIALRRAGAEVTIFERRASLEDEGTGLALRPAAVEALSRLGVTLSGAQLDGWRYAAVKDGEAKVRVGWRAPLTAYTYAALRAALLDQAAGIELRRGAAVTAVASHGERARLRVGDADVESDLVVAADGVDSLAQRVLFPAARPEYTGIVLWRGFAREEEARAVLSAEALDALTNVNTQLFASSAKGWWLCHVIPSRTAGGGRKFAWLCYLREEESSLAELLTDADGIPREWGTKPGKVSGASLARLRRTLRANFPEVVAALSEVGLVSVNKVAKLLVPAMAVGRICLVGDAAHVVPPLTTAGATLAIGDAAALAGTVATTGAGAEALAAWSDGRLAAARAVLAQGDALIDATIDHPPDLASSTVEELTAWARKFLPPGAERQLEVSELAGQPLLFKAGQSPMSIG